MNFIPFETKEETILSRVAQGDQTAVEECLNKYGNLVWALAKRYSANREDAEDAVQEIFMEIWQNAHRYDSTKAKEITFISTIARRRLIDRLRKIYRRPNIKSIEDMIETSGYESQLYTRMQARQITEAMQNLRPEQREMMCLNIYEGMSHGEISEHTGIPLGTVKTHIRRGFKRVREMMSYRKIENSPAVMA